MVLGFIWAMSHLWKLRVTFYVVNESLFTSHPNEESDLNLRKGFNGLKKIQTVDVILDQLCQTSGGNTFLIEPAKFESLPARLTALRPSTPTSSRSSTSSTGRTKPSRRSPSRTRERYSHLSNKRHEWNKRHLVFRWAKSGLNLKYNKNERPKWTSLW